MVGDGVAKNSLKPNQQRGASLVVASYSYHQLEVQMAKELLATWGPWLRKGGEVELEFADTTQQHHSQANKRRRRSRVGSCPTY